MLDIQTKQYIDSFIKTELQKRDRENASGILFDQNTGRHTQGQNLVGLTGNRAIHNIIRTNLTEQTIASGVINFTSSDIKVYTQSSASSDDLDTINPSVLAQGGDFLLLRAGDDADTVTIKNNTGNILCRGDFKMDDIDDRILLQWDAVNAKWIEICRSNNNDVQWTTWTPTYGAGGTMTFTSVTTSLARYKTIDNIVFFQIKATGTTGGTANTHITFTLPITPANTANDDISGACYYVDGGGAIPGLFSYGNSAAAIRVYKNDSTTNWGLGSNRSIRIQGFYEI